MMKHLFTAAFATTLLLSSCQESPSQLSVPAPQAQQAEPQSTVQNKSFRWQVLIQPPKAQGRTPLKPDLLTSFAIGNLQIPVEQIQRLDLPASRAATAQPEPVISPDAPVQVQYKGNGQYVIQFKQAPPKPWIVQMQIQGYDQPASFPWVESQSDQSFTVQISRNAVGQTQVKGFYPQLTQSVRSFTVEPQPDNQQDLVWQQADGSSKRMDFDQMLQASQTGSAAEPANDTASDSQIDSAWPSSFDDSWNQTNDTSMNSGSDTSISENPWAEVDQMFGQLEGSSSSNQGVSATEGWDDGGFSDFPTAPDSGSASASDSTADSGDSSSEDSSSSSGDDS